MNVFDILAKAYISIISEQSESQTAQDLQNDDAELTKETPVDFEELEKLRPDMTNLYEMLIALGMLGAADRETEFTDILKNGEIDKHDNDIEEFNKLIGKLDSINWNVSFKDFSSLWSMKDILLTVMPSMKALNANSSKLCNLLKNGVFDRLINSEPSFINSLTDVINAPREYYEYILNMFAECNNEFTELQLSDMFRNIYCPEDLVIEFIKKTAQHSEKRDLALDKASRRKNISDKLLKAIKELSGNSEKHNLNMLYNAPFSAEEFKYYLDNAYSIGKELGDTDFNPSSIWSMECYWWIKIFAALTVNPYVPTDIAIEALKMVMKHKKYVYDLVRGFSNPEVIRYAFVNYGVGLDRESPDLEFRTDQEFAANRNTPSDILDTLIEKYKKKTKYKLGLIRYAMKNKKLKNG